MDAQALCGAERAHVLLEVDPQSAAESEQVLVGSDQWPELGPDELARVIHVLARQGRERDVFVARHRTRGKSSQLGESAGTHRLTMTSCEARDSHRARARGTSRGVPAPSEETSSIAARSSIASASS